MVKTIYLDSHFKYIVFFCVRKANALIMDHYFNDGNMYFPNHANNLKCYTHDIYWLIDNNRKRH